MKDYTYATPHAYKIRDVQYTSVFFHFLNMYNFIHMCIHILYIIFFRKAECRERGKFSFSTLFFKIYNSRDYTYTRTLIHTYVCMCVPDLP